MRFFWFDVNNKIYIFFHMRTNITNHSYCINSIKQSYINFFFNGIYFFAQCFSIYAIKITNDTL